MVEGLPAAGSGKGLRAETRFPPHPAAARAARVWLREQVGGADDGSGSAWTPRVVEAGWRAAEGGTGAVVLGEEVLDAAELLLSEVVTNAVVHAGSATVVMLDLSSDRLRIDVHDSSPSLPEHHVEDADDPFATTGRGLPLLDLCSDSWGWYRTGRGKAVWFVVAGCDSTGAVEAAGAPSRQSRGAVGRSA